MSLDREKEREREGERASMVAMTTDELEARGGAETLWIF